MPLSREALADLVKPSVVRIAEHVTGTARIPAIKVDIRKHLVAVIPDSSTDVTVDEYFSGSGFVIHSDGYIATNAHVVSLETVKSTLASESALSAIYENALVLSDQEMQDFLGDESNKAFAKEIIRYVIAHGEFDLKHDLSVMRPGSQDTKIADFITNGFPAEVVVVNENFLDDERDVAIIKIEEHDLPALQLGGSDSFSVGKQIYIFGFPATAEINSKDPAEATFTSGSVSAIKQTLDGNLKIFQTDAKVSQGSSGGPLFNERGEVLGLITFQTDELSRAAGDNFAFALPVGIVTDLALGARILPEEGVYSRAFKLGFAAFLEKHCTTAQASFQEAETTNSAFSPARYISPYLEKCAVWQREGQARDNSWTDLRARVGALSEPLLYLIGGGLVSLGILGVMMYWLLRQLRREEQTISVLEQRLQADEEELYRHEQRVGEKKLSSPERPVTPPGKPRLL